MYLPPCGRNVGHCYFHRSAFPPVVSKYSALNIHCLANHNEVVRVIKHKNNFPRPFFLPLISQSLCFVKVEGKAQLTFSLG